MPGLKNAARRVLGLPTYIWLARLLAARSATTGHDGLQVADAAMTNGLIRLAIAEGKAAAIGKIGATELRAIREFLALAERARARPARSVLAELHVSGVFPPNAEMLTSFAKYFVDVAARMDLLVAWLRPGEREVFERYCQTATLISLEGLDPFFSDQPWTAALAGKTVLVASPFVDSIAAQYRRRRQVWPHRPDLLPEFELQPMRIPFSDRLVRSPRRDWFEALESLSAELRSHRYDVLLIGAGAFSLPLAVVAKEMGKIGIHLGGSTQILFGIRGARWDCNPAMSGLYNEHWVRPSPHETPKGYRKVEAGCYW